MKRALVAAAAASLLLGAAADANAFCRTDIEVVNALDRDIEVQWTFHKFKHGPDGWIQFTGIPQKWIKKGKSKTWFADSFLASKRKLRLKIKYDVYDDQGYRKKESVVAKAEEFKRCGAKHVIVVD